MEFKVMRRSDAGLWPASDSPLYEFYHCASKLSGLASDPTAQVADNGLRRYLTTRGFRDFGSENAVALPEEITSASASLSDVLISRRTGRKFGDSLTLNQLGSVLQSALGCTAIGEDQGEGLMHALRAWPSAGGLYPLDVYVLAAKVTGVDPGLYYFHPLKSELQRVPSRQVAEIIDDGFFDKALVQSAAVSIVFVAAFPRTVSKYGERGYRLVLLDAGHAGQNVLLMSEALGLDAVAIGGFNDDALHSDLKVDGVEEAVVHVISMGTRI